MSDIIKKTENFIQLHNMLEGVDTVITGLSGGADSVCLLWILKQLSIKYNFNIVAVHINHMIRPEAYLDESFAKKLCDSWDIPFKVYREDVPAYAKSNNISSEEAGRMIRYRSFNEEAQRAANRLIKDNNDSSIYAESKKKDAINRVKIATAHHMGDQAETVLLNLFRGSGLTGMKGIDPKRDLIIRPLLCLTRQEIESCLKDNNISWCIDATNNTDDYTRNRIRRKIIPYADENISQGVVSHICSTSAIVREALGFIEKEVKKAFSRCIKDTGKGFEISLSDLNKENNYIKGELLLFAVGEAAGKRKDIERIHIEILKELCEREGNRSINLPYGLKAIREYNKVIIFRESLEDDSKITCDIIIPAIKTRTFEFSSDMTVPKKGYTKWFDYDKIKQNVPKYGWPVIRSRREGDYLVISANGSKKTIKRYMIDEKIPPSKRDEVLLLTQGSHVLWVIGGRTSMYYHIGNDTKIVWEAVYPEEGRNPSAVR